MMLVMILLVALCAAQVWYWCVYFPRAWRDRSNDEINSIRNYVEFVRNNPQE